MLEGRLQLSLRIIQKFFRFHDLHDSSSPHSGKKNRMNWGLGHGLVDGAAFVEANFVLEEHHKIPKHQEEVIDDAGSKFITQKWLESTPDDMNNEF